jgi:hypothetical protein
VDERQPLLAYDPPTDLVTRALRVNATKTAQVRLIFRRYIELGTVSKIVRSPGCAPVGRQACLRLARAFPTDLRSVRRKSLPAHKACAALTARNLRQGKFRSLEMSIRKILWGFG